MGWARDGRAVKRLMEEWPLQGRGGHPPHPSPLPSVPSMPSAPPTFHSARNSPPSGSLPWLPPLPGWVGDCSLNACAPPCWSSAHWAVLVCVRPCFLPWIVRSRCAVTPPNSAQAQPWSRRPPVFGGEMSRNVEKGESQAHGGDNIWFSWS